MRTRDVLILAATALGCTTLHAQSSVVNGDFSTDLSSWFAASDTESEITVDWTPLDSNGDVDSGSALIGNHSTGPQNGVALQQCLPAIAGETYIYGGKIRVPSGAGQSLDNKAFVSVFWFSDANCSINIGGPVSIGGSPASFDIWVTKGPSDIVARDGSHSVLVRALVTKVDAGGDFFAAFDDLYLIPPDPVFANGFE